VNGKQRILNMIGGAPVDHLPFMPITMMFAGDVIGVPYRRYASDYRVLVEGQLRTAEEFGFDYVSAISDPAREAADCGATLTWFDNQPPDLCEEQSLLTDKSRLKDLPALPAASGGRCEDRLRAVESLRRGVGDELLVDINNFRKSIVLPNVLVGRKTEGADFEQGMLNITFAN
jgi:hypothetical protein